MTYRSDFNSFFFSNYIIGQFESRLSPMTVDAEGVKVYGNIQHATILNASLSADWQILSQLKWSVKVAYALGRDDVDANLPLISPLDFLSKLNLSLKKFSVEAAMLANAKQSDFGVKYGESPTPAFAIFNLSAQYSASLASASLSLRAGVENLFDKAYSSYSDWNKIPQKGRNIYLNICLSL